MSLIENALEKLRRTGAAAAVRAEPNRPRPSDAPNPSTPEVPQRRISFDFTGLRGVGYYPEQSRERRLSDNYRQIKRALIEEAFTVNGSTHSRVIIVSSALPGDGKTFTSINLALNIARSHDISVLLIDADVPKGRISDVFGIGRECGLTDSLADQSLDVESLIVRTDLRNLDILPAGRIYENATELLASERMAQVIARLCARNPRRLLVFDAPPLLVSSEACALVQVPAQVVLVVRAGKTPRQAILDAIAQVSERNLRGLVLNDVGSRSGDGYYGNYSGYAGYGAASDEVAASHRSD